MATTPIEGYDVSSMKVYPRRFPPGAKIKSNLLEFVKFNQPNVALILSCASLSFYLDIPYNTITDTISRI